mmetsp:Transcript_19457/g.49469  ORF Transcript_19457/g.49469 Transcript_19457/m.49469 type:complete len:326 (+) Transcript_19457:1341-2318(+)
MRQPPFSPPFRSGVTVSRISGHDTKQDSTNDPGALTVSDESPAGTRHAMLRLSFPPVMAMPSSIIMSFRARAASNMRGPSPGSLAAHIQLPEDLISCSADTRAHTRLVRASPTHMRPIFAQSSRPIGGRSPMEMALPATPRMERAHTDTSASGVCSGPTHCCWATRPVTLRSTLFVRKRLLATAGRVSTRCTASATIKLAGSARGDSGSGRVSMGKVLRGMSPSTLSSGRLTGVFTPSSACVTTICPSPVTVPTNAMGEPSRCAIPSRRFWLSAVTSTATCSWYSAPHSSNALNVGSPLMIFVKSIMAPAGSQISFNTFPDPPAP